MKKIRTILFFLSAVCWIFTALSVESIADETHPYAYSYQREYSGWILKTNENTFFIRPQPAWSQEAQIESWRGVQRQDQRFTSLPGVNLISAAAHQNFLFILVLKNSKTHILQLDSTLTIQNEFPLEIPVNSLHEITWLSNNKKQLCLLAGKLLFSISGQLKVISQNAENAVFQDNGNIVFLEKIGVRNVVNFLDANAIEIRSVQLSAGAMPELEPAGNSVASLQTLGEVTSVDISSSERGIYLRGLRIPAQKDFIVFKKDEVIFLKKASRNYEVHFAPVSNPAASKITVELPVNLIEPMVLKSEKGKIIVVFRNGLVTLDEAGQILSQDYIRAGEWFKNSKPDVTFTQGGLLLATAEKSVFLKENTQPFWLANRFFQTSGRFVLPLIFLLISIWLIRRYLRQRAILQAVVDMPASGIVLVLDSRQRLVKVNNSARKLLKMPPKVPLKRMLRYYCQMESCRELLDFVDAAYLKKEEIRQKISLSDGRISEEILCTALPLRSFTGVFRGLVITGADITEELEKKRLVNWAQLAHDMQTNLSVVRLNAEQFSSEDEGNQARRKKILFQVGLILQRVRDLVTVGRTDTLDLISVNARELCESVLKEFDEQMFPHVEFFVESEEFMFTCDRNMLIRALRNAAENAVRALKGKPGKVILKGRMETGNVFISVIDTGAGMSEELQKNMFTPFFTTGQHQGGTGIGTMIMQHVAHLHGGEIIVQSEVGKGTEIIFKIPDGPTFVKNKTSYNSKALKQ